MRELDADRVPAEAPARRDDASDLGLVVLVIEAGAAVRDAAFARHVRRFDHQQSRAAVGELAEVDQMPVVQAAVVGLVLTHRRDDDAVGQRNGAELDRRKEFGEHG